MRPLLLLAALVCAAAQAQARAAHSASATAPARPYPHPEAHHAHRLLRDGAATAAVAAPAPAAAAALATASVASRIDGCRQRCPSAYLPVCGAGGTYLNACWAACMGAEPFAVGDCDAAADKFQRSLGSGCEARCAAAPGAPAQPACAENGFTFTSACVAKCSNLATAAGTCCASFAKALFVAALARRVLTARSCRAGLRAALASNALAAPPPGIKSG